MESYIALKRKEILSHATKWMNPEDTMLSKISQSKKDKFCDLSEVSNQIHRRNPNSKKYKVERWLSGFVRRAKRAAVNGYRV